MSRNIAILGSTGSIGVNALDVLRRLKREKISGSPPYRVWGLAARKSGDLLKKQIQEFQPAAAVLWDRPAALELKRWAARKNLSLIVWDGLEGLIRMAGHSSVDFVLSGVVGVVGLQPLLSAVNAGKKVGLANKEALIVGGDLVIKAARRSGAEIIPVDSEHSAIFQCLSGPNSSGGSVTPEKTIRRLILTASGGAFYRRKGSLDRVTVNEALDHPTWKMGKKITIDCATLTNKGLEAIEAHHLFQVPMDQIHIVVHPQSIIHSLVEFTDGAMLAQLSHPDMRLPIQYALTHPERRPTPIRTLNLEEIQKLEFHKPDFRRFPCLALALNAGRKGGTWPAVFNAANEVAVKAFLEEKLSFLGISRLLEKVMNSYSRIKKRDRGQREVNIRLSDIRAVDQLAREMAEDFLKKGGGFVS